MSTLARRHLAAEPGACLWLGTAPGVSGERLIERVAAGADDDEVRSLLHRIEPRPGDTLLVEAGTVHAIGGGLTLYEIQQNSDATWRIHDWGRGREVHLEQARASLRSGPRAEPLRLVPAADTWATIAECDAFRLQRGRVEHALEIAPRGACAILTVLAGQGALEDGSSIRPGDTHLLLRTCRLTGAGLDVLLAEPGAP